MSERTNGKKTETDRKIERNEGTRTRHNGNAEAKIETSQLIDLWLFQSSIRSTVVLIGNDSPFLFFPPLSPVPSTETPQSQAKSQHCRIESIAHSHTNMRNCSD